MPCTILDCQRISKKILFFFQNEVVEKAYDIRRIKKINFLSS